MRVTVLLLLACWGKFAHPHSELTNDLHTREKQVRDRVEWHLGPGYGYTVDLDYMAPMAGRVLLEITDGKGDVLLHISPYYNWEGQTTLILNSYIDGEWGEEELPSGFPLTPGDRTTTTVTLGEDAYEIYGNGDQFHYSYTHRVHIREIRDVQWSTEGDHVEGILQTGRVITFKIGREVFIDGIVPEGSEGLDAFGLDIIPLPSQSTGLPFTQDNIALHFKTDFERKIVVCNSKIDGKWGEEEENKLFLFTPGDEFNILIALRDDGYDIYTNWEFFTTYEHRIPYAEVMAVIVGGVPLTYTMWDL